MHGIFSHGFPNCFIVSQTQGGFTANYPHLLDEVSTHIAYVIGELRTRGHDRVDVTVEAEDAWVEEIVGSARSMAAFQESCTPGSYNNEGQPLGRSGQNGSYGRGNIAFWKILGEWREAGDLAGLDIS